MFSLTVSYCQKAEYNKVSEKSTFEEYLSKNNDIIKIGDTLIIGNPTSDLGFTYIFQGGQRVSNTLTTKKVIVTKIKSYGNQENGYKVYVHFTGYGIIPVLIDYETAFELGEILNPKSKISRKQAIVKLKETKELLDLGVINIEQYEKEKAELIKIILK